MQFYQGLKDVLGFGLDPKDLTFFQISVRGIIVFLAALLMARLANRRFLSKLSAFDAILGFILASMLARAVNGSSAFFPTLGCGFVLVGLHRLLAAIAFRFKRFGGWVKESAEVLVEQGRQKTTAMRFHNISDEDLMEEARLNGQVTRMDEIKTATLERNGQVSIIPSKE